MLALTTTIVPREDPGMCSFIHSFIHPRKMSYTIPINMSLLEVRDLLSKISDEQNRMLREVQDLEDRAQNLEMGRPRPRPARADQPRADQPLELLPYHVLLEIFVYASESSNDPSEDRRTARWLLNAARTCKALIEPALTALYRSPPLLTVVKGGQLHHDLKRDPALTRYNYRNKIHRLEINVVPVLGFSRSRENHFDIAELVSLTPNLRHLRLVEPRVPVNSNTAGWWSRWTYPEKLFDALERTGIRLRSWGWDRRLTRPDCTMSFIKAAHLLPPFQTLVHVAFIRYNGTFDESPLYSGSDASSPGGPQRLNGAVELADALSVLSRLQSLHFERCPIVTDALLQRLPEGLTSLRLVDCPNLTFETLESYLRSHLGRSLRRLKLRSDDSMKPAFLAKLDQYCPELQVLDLECRYDNPRHSYGTHLEMALSEVFESPRWPSTLQHLELVNFRMATIATAEAFFEALVRAGPNLPHLRELVFKAIIEDEWRARATFRELWVPRLKRIFKRKSDPPSTALMSMKHWRAYKEGLVSSVAGEHGKIEKHQHEGKKSGPTTPSTPLRRSSRLNGGSTTVSPGESSSFSSKTKKNTHEQPSLDNLSPRPAKRRKTEIERLAEAAGCDRLGFINPGGPSSAGKQKQDVVASTGPRTRAQDKGKGKAKVLGPIRKNIAKYYEHEEEDDDEEEDLGRGRGRGKGPIRKNIAKYYEPMTKEELQEQAKQEEEEWNKGVPIHGLCDFVDVSVDNIRPREVRFTEADFIDEEPSDDEEWDGYDYEFDEDAALAW